MKLCIGGDIYFIPKFHILKTGTVKLSIETGLRAVRAGPDRSKIDIIIIIMITKLTCSLQDLCHFFKRTIDLRNFLLFMLDFGPAESVIMGRTSA
jgi:hypothetical protein